MFSNIGVTEFVLIAIVGLLLFGPKKLPEIGRALGRAMQEFKAGARGLVEDQPLSAADKAALVQEVKEADKQDDPEYKKQESAAPLHNPKRLPE